MTIKEKTIRILEFSGKKSDWKIWSRKFLAKGNLRGYKNLVVGTTKVPTSSAYETACGQSNPTPAHTKIIETYKLSIKAFEDLILSINGETKAGRVAFDLVDQCCIDANPDGDPSLAWNRLVQKYKPRTAPSYIKLKRQFANSKLEDAADAPDDWITMLEGLKMEMNKVKIPGKTNMS